MYISENISTHNIFWDCTLTHEKKSYAKKKTCSAVLLSVLATLVSGVGIGRVLTSVGISGVSSSVGISGSVGNLLSGVGNRLSSVGNRLSGVGHGSGGSNHGGGNGNGFLVDVGLGGDLKNMFMKEFRRFDREVLGSGQKKLNFMFMK